MLNYTPSPAALSNEGFFLFKDEEIRLAWALQDAGSHREALHVVSKYLGLKPYCFQSHYLASVCYQALGDWESAEENVRFALEADPQSHYALNVLAEIQLAKGVDPQVVIVAFERASELAPDFVNPILNIGNLYWKDGDVENALRFYRKAIEVDPSAYEPCYNYARALHQKALLVDAIAFYSKACKLNKRYAEPFWNKSLCYLLSGDYERGWSLYDSRLKLSLGHPLHAKPSLPLWKGISPEKADDEPVLLVTEQGFGDTIQFIRYIRILSDQGLSVRLAAQPQLHDLIVASGLHPSPVEPGECSQYTDGCWLPLLSLPGLLGVTPSNVISNEPYLRPLKRHLSKWRKLLSKENLPVVGIHWQGSQLIESSNESFRGRSIPLEMFGVLLESNDVRFLSLQKGFGSEQIQQCSFLDAFVGCQGEVDRTWDFLETLAIIDACDLVITSDSAVAHLAGGLGKPTWLLLMHVPEWRWGLESDQTFWYPSLRLFRQERQGDWQGLLERVASALSDYLLDLGAGLSPNRKSLPVYGDSLRVGLRKNKDRLLQVTAPFWEWVEGSAKEPTRSESDSVDLDQVGLIPSVYKAGGVASSADIVVIANSVLSEDSVEHAADVDRLVQVLGHSRHPSICHALGRIYLRRDCVDQAIECFRAALKSQTPQPSSLAFLALCWQIKGRLSRAQGLYRAAIRVGGDSANVLCNYACLLHETGNIPGAVELLERAISLDPAFVDAHCNLSYALLSLGDYQRGWAEYEWRMQRPSVPILLADPGCSQWDGISSLSAKTLLVMGEQGLGDILQSWRYVHSLERDALRCIACLPQCLHRLIRSAGFSGELIGPDELPSAVWDEWVALGSLPQLHAASPSNPGAVNGYLQVGCDPLAERVVDLSPADQPLVGICWQGNPAAERFVLRGRSIPLHAFAPLVAAAPVRLLSLQKLVGLDQFDECAFRSSFVDWQDEFTPVLDFADVAIMMQRCDLIITVDTSVAHLAGAMGLPTWLLLHQVPDWRWGLDGDTTFWYPSMRLFRQREAGDWDEVMQRVAVAFQDFVSTRSG